MTLELPGPSGALCRTHPGFPPAACGPTPPRRLTSSSAHSEGSTVCEGRQNCWHTPRL